MMIGILIYLVTSPIFSTSMTYSELSQLRKTPLFSFLRGVCGGCVTVMEVYADTVESAKEVATLNRIKYDFITKQSIME